jgi:membrane-associated protein
MDFLVQAIIPYILLYKYWALFITTFLASFALPIPAGTLLIASAAFSSQGYFNIAIIFIVVLIANIAGDNLSYWFARLYGRHLLSRIPFIQKILVSKDFNLIEKGISRRPGFIIFISRFEVISTLTINLICGLGKATYKKFLLFEALGSLANVIFYIIIGYSFGDSWQAVNKLIGNFSILLFLVIALGISLFWKKILAKLKKEMEN